MNSRAAQRRGCAPSDSSARAGTMASPARRVHAVCMPDLNNADPTPPEESRAKLRQAEEESRRKDSPARTNDSTIEPEKPKDDILDGFHGG